MVPRKSNCSTAQIGLCLISWALPTPSEPGAWLCNRQQKGQTPKIYFANMIWNWNIDLFLSLMGRLLSCGSHFIDCHETNSFLPYIISTDSKREVNKNGSLENIETQRLKVTPKNIIIFIWQHRFLLLSLSVRLSQPLFLLSPIDGVQCSKAYL